MSDSRLFRYLHELVRLERYPLLRRWHHLGRDKALLAFDRDAVARAVAIGFFFGILTPVAQILFTLIVAIAVRANVLVAAGSTLITNPIILPFVYYLAYRIGLFLTGRGWEAEGGAQEALRDVTESEEAAARALEVASWFETLTAWATSVGLPLLVGVVTLAVAAALTGYVVVQVAWGWIARFRER